MMITMLAWTLVEKGDVEYFGLGTREKRLMLPGLHFPGIFKEKRGLSLIYKFEYISLPRLHDNGMDMGHAV